MVTAVDVRFDRRRMSDGWTAERPRVVRLVSGYSSPPVGAQEAARGWNTSAVGWNLWSLCAELCAFSTTCRRVDVWTLEVELSPSGGMSRWDSLPGLPMSGMSEHVLGDVPPMTAF